MPRIRKQQRKRKNRQRRGSDQLSRSVKVLSSVPQALSTVHRFRRCWNQSTSYVANTGFFSAAFDMEINFCLNTSDIRLGGVSIYGPTIPSYTEFTSLYDDYRIKKVILRLDWSQNSYSGSTTTIMPPLLYYVQDFNDSNAVSLSTILQYPEVKTHSFYQNGYKPLIMELTPRPLVDLAGTGVGTGYGPTLEAPWIRTSETNIPHYGVKIYGHNFDVATASATGFVNIMAAFELEFRGVK